MSTAIIIVVVLLVLLLFIGGGYYLYLSKGVGNMPIIEDRQISNNETYDEEDEEEDEYKENVEKDEDEEEKPNDDDESTPSDEPETTVMASPADLLSTFKGSGRKFQLALFQNGELECVRIDMGSDDKFDSGDRVHVMQCDVNDERQYWTYDNNDRFIKTYTADKDNRKLCLDYDSKKKEFKVTKCDDKPKENRQFMIDPALEAELTNVNGMPRWDPEHDLDNDYIPIRVKPESDSNAYCIANPSYEEGKDQKIAECTDTTTRLYLIGGK